jgi:DNA-binding transcriptional MerR regulator
MGIGGFEPLWTVADVAIFLGVPVHTLYGWRTKAYGPAARRIGKHLRYRPDDVRAWVDQLNEEVA